MFDCNQCGECCRRISQSEVTKHLDRGDGVCQHFDDNTKLCLIYENRPNFCNVDKSYLHYFKHQFTLDEYYKINEDLCKIFQQKKD